MTSNDKSEVFHFVLPSIMSSIDKFEVFHDVVLPAEAKGYDEKSHAPL